MRALQHSQDTNGLLKAVYFIHIPPPGKQGDPASEEDYEPLASAMTELILCREPETGSRGPAAGVGL